MARIGYFRSSPAEELVSNLSDSKEQFDPYRIWLSIPKAEQPPHHYRLLGLPLFETDERVIEEAADRQVAHLKNKATSTYVAQAQELLNEVATAAAVLLDAEAKAKYDQKLQSKLAEKTAPVAKPAVLQAKPLPTARPIAQPLPAQARPLSVQQPSHSAPQALAQPQQSVAQTQQPVPLQPLRPIPLSPEQLAAAPASVIPTSVVPAKNSAASKQRRKEKNPLVEIVKIVLGGVAGLGLGVFILVAIGRGDLLFGLVGVGPPPKIVIVNEGPKANPGGKRTTPQPVPQPNVGESSGTKSGTTTAPTSVSGPTSPGRNIPALPQETEESDETQPPAKIPPHTDRIRQPEITVASRQLGSTAVRESLSFLTDVFTKLETNVVRPGNRALARDQLAVVQRLELDAERLEENGMAAFRRTALQQFEGIDAKYRGQGASPSFSGRLLGLISLPARPNASEPQGQIFKINNVDEFPNKLLETADHLLKLAVEMRTQPEPHDRLYYLATLAQLLHYSYIRGNADQFAACVALISLTGEAEQVVRGNEGAKMRIANYVTLAAAGMAQTGDDLAKDPRTHFRSAGSLFSRALDGTWTEQSATRGAISYRENQRSVAEIKLLPLNGGPIVRLALGWSVTLSPSRLDPARSEEVFTEGEWEITKSSRSLVPKMAVTTPGQVPGAPGQQPPGQVARNNPPSAIIPVTQPPPGTAVPNVADLKPGDRVHILWGEGWYPGNVVQIIGTRALIHYDNLDNDETVTRSRLRLMNGAPPNMVVGNPPNISQPPQPVTGGAIPAPAGVKKLWRHSAGFIELSDGVWREFSPTGDWFTLNLISQSPESTELERSVGAVRLRLNSKTVELALPPYTNYIEIAKGSWIKPLEELELDPKQTVALKKHLTTHAEIVAKSRKQLLTKFEAMMSSTRNRVGKAEERLALIAVLEDEQVRFEREGLVPWSSPMRTHTADYVKGLNAARNAVESNFDRAIDFFVNHDQAEAAHAVLVLKQKTLAPVVIARVVARDVVDPQPRPRFAGGGFPPDRGPAAPIPPGLPADIVEQLNRDREQRGFTISQSNTHRLWSNGNVDDAFGASKWIADNTGVMLSITRATSSIRLRYAISEKGDEFAAQSTQGSSFAGMFGGALESYEKRPEVKYNPPEGKATELPAAVPATPAVP